MRYVEAHDLTAVAAPLKNGDSLVLVLPKDASASLRPLAPAAQKALLDEMRNAVVLPVDAWLPEFQIDAERELGDDLRNIGVAAPFGPMADFSPMFAGAGAGEPPYIDKISQRATIVVNTDGVVARAVTTMRALSLSHQRFLLPFQRFVVDRPFLFYLMDGASGAVTFQGAIVDPQAPIATYDNSAARVLGARLQAFHDGFAQRVRETRLRKRVSTYWGAHLRLARDGIGKRPPAPPAIRPISAGR